MPQFEVEFNIVCAKCRRTLQGTATSPYLRNNSFTVEVEPCEYCIDDARSDGYESGKRDAEDEEE